MTTSTELPTVPEQRTLFKNTGTGADYAALAPMLFLDMVQNIYRGPAAGRQYENSGVKFLEETLRWKTENKCLNPAFLVTFGQLGVRPPVPPFHY